MMYNDKKQHKGFTLILSIIIASIVLAIGAALLAVALGQFRISGIGYDSEMAFHAAGAGIECARYFDVVAEDPVFDVGAGHDRFVQCMGESAPRCIRANPNAPEGTCSNAPVESGEEQRLEYDWTNGPENLCTKISVWKFYAPDTNGIPGDETESIDVEAGNFGSCPEDVECTVIQSRGYNRSCGDLDSLRTVERELIMRY